MHTEKPGAESKWVDPDDAPRLTREWFGRAEHYHGDKLVRRGRPKSARPKEAVSLRLDPDVLEYFRKTGSRWQSRINEALRKAAGL
ncbi:MAG TPA: BrnA antitoxin family protein [Roseiarcus sp.]|nr:BrnA antitoxin family protein [Roseiarcus sp.]